MARFGDLDTQYFDDAGNPLVNGKVYFYESGTTTLKNTFADVNLSIPNTNPVILTAAGRQPNIFFDGVAKAILTSNSDVQILVRDPVGETATDFGDEWVATKIYGANDVVLGSDGVYYRSLVSGNQNNNPVSTTNFWTLLYSVEWNAGITYQVGAVVTYDGEQYQSLQGSNLNQNPSTASSYWVLLSFAWLATATYAEDQNAVGTDGILYTSLQNGNIGNDPATSPAYWVGTSAAAAASATAAAASATAAAASETAAETAETNAETAQTAAEAAQTAAETAETNAETAETNAASSATAAASSASAASTSETNAATSATNAASSATAASGSASAAATSATSASNSASAAAASETAAETAETNAETAQTAAEAAQSAAETAETNAETAETNAASSASAASTSASNAATSASNAATSATASAASAAAAAASYDAFDDRYLGDKASDPTLDNDGNALLTGALYFNTTSDVMKVYDGSAWNIAAISSASPTFTGDLTLESTDAGAGEGPEIFLHRNSASPAASDVLGVINFDGENSVGSKHTYGKIKGVILDPTNTSEDGKLVFQARGAGAAFADILTVNSTGIDVTGTATMDGLILDQTTNSITTGTSDGSDNARLFLCGGGTSSINRGGNISVYGNEYASVGGNVVLAAGDALTGGAVEGHIRMLTGPSRNRLLIEDSGDISFYEDTGTTPKFFWDASAESLGIGTTSPTDKLNISSGTNQIGLDTGNQATYGTLDIGHFTNGAFIGTQAGSNSASNLLRFGTSGTERMRIDSSGNVLLNATNSFIGTNTTDGADNKQLVLGGGGTSSVLRGAYISLKGNEFATDSGSITYVTGKGSSDHIWFDGNSVLERMRLTSSGDIRLTGAAPNAEDNISTINFYNSSSSTNLARITGKRTAGGTNYGSLTFSTTSSGSIAERMRIDSSGNVGIGTSSPSSDLHIASSLATIRLEDSDIAGGAAYSLITGSSAGNIAFSADPDNVRSSSDIRFNVDGTERMRISSSGNLLVGTTITDLQLSSSVEGFTYANNFITSSRSGGVTAYFNRLSSDGDIAAFRKDGTTVGSIGTTTDNGRFRILDTSNRGFAIRTADGETALEPSTTTAQDGYGSIGTSGGRWKDLYLSGGVYLGGTGAANLLDDYEEGTFTPVVADASTGGNTATGTFSGSYTKIGKVVTARVALVNINTSGMTGANQLYIRGFPFASDGLAQGIVTFNSITTTAVGSVTAYMSASTAARLSEQLSGAAQDFVDVQDLASGVTDINMTLIYEV